MFERMKRLFGYPRDAADPPRPPPHAPFEFLVVPGAAAAEEMKRAAGRAGVVPVLMGDRAEFDQVVEQMSLNDEDFDAIRDAGLGLDVDAWMKDRIEADPHAYNVEHSGTLGTAEQIAPLSPARDMAGRFRKEVFIGLVPVDEPWLVPAYLKGGGWNECPLPEVHVAFFRRWHQRYGAIVTTVTGDIIEFAVSRPPRSAEESFALAREQFVYCDDIVHQGVGSLENLAAAVRGSSHWYFWWD